MMPANEMYNARSNFGARAFPSCADEGDQGTQEKDTIDAHWLSLKS